MHKKLPRILATVTCTAALFVSPLARAQQTPSGDEPAVPNEEQVCPVEGPGLDRYRYMRSLSLDLRGELPALDELRSLEDAADVPAALIEEWLASDAFLERVVRHHRGLLWGNITNVGLTRAFAGFRTTAGLYWRTGPSAFYRGATVGCLDEPARFDENGSILTREVDGAQREGYVMVAPYWDPTTPLKVCAFDAQANLVSPSGAVCGTPSDTRDPGCGCGPELRWCRAGQSERMILESMAEDVERRIATLIREGRPYTELFTSRRAFVNGPLVHYWRYQTEIPGGVRLTPLPLDVSTLPDLAFTDRDTWVEVELDDAHAGVLTSPLFLLRFQTNRARANRFFNAFLCQPFQPPAGGIPLTGEGATEIDLQKRAGCKYCHALLEPAAAHWGRWTENGAGFLSPELYPPTRSDCQLCAQTGVGCSAQCRSFYVTSTLSPDGSFLGYLKPYEFLRSEHRANVEEGPRLLASTTVVDGRLPRCVARTTATWLLGREMTAADEAWIEDLTVGFAFSGFRYDELVKSIVTSDTYRRVR